MSDANRKLFVGDVVIREDYDNGDYGVPHGTIGTVTAIGDGYHFSVRWRGEGRSRRDGYHEDELMLILPLVPARPHRVRP